MSTTAYPRTPESTRFDLEYDRMLHGDRDTRGHPDFDEQQDRISLSRIEAIIVFAVFALGYFLLGLHVLDTNHVVVFDAIDRLTRGYMAWWDSPPKLAALGFVYPPLQSFVFLPFAAIKPLATSLVALPLVSALFAAMTMVSLDAILVRCRFGLGMRLATLLALGLNPLWAFYASNGMNQSVYSFFLVASLAGFVAWYITEETRFLVGAGMALALAALTRYDLAVFGLFLGLLVGGVLVRRRSSAAHVEGSVTAFAAPLVYALVMWTMFNVIIVGKPFSWLSNPSNLAVNSDQFGHHGGASFSALVSHGAELTAGIAPLAIIAFVFLIVQYFAAGNTMALALAMVIALTVVLLGVDALLSNNISDMTIGSAIPVMFAGVIGGAWVFRHSAAAQLIAGLVMLALLILAIPLTWSLMKSYPYQNLEQAFARSVFTNKDETGIASRGGYRVGLMAEQQMADYINATVGHRYHAVLTDNAQTYAVILLSGRAGVFFNRVDRGDAPWRSVLGHPYGRVQYMLIASQDAGDLIRQRYPGASNGTLAPQLTPIFTTVGNRYTLVRVAGRSSTGTRSSTQAGSAASSSGFQNAVPTRSSTSTTGTR